MTNDTNTGLILRTKLHRPPAPRDYVHRPQLLESLEKHRERRLSLVSDSAGYDKSTLLSVFKIRFCAFVQQGSAMLNTVGILPVLLLWAAVVSVSCFNVAVVCAQKTALEPVTIQLRWFHQFQFAGYYAAIEKGFYAEEGLQVSLREFEPGKDRIAPVLEGKAQYGVGDPALLRLRFQGKPVVVLAQIFQHSPSVLITLRESGIYSPDELAGKKVMMTRDGLGGVPIRAMILDTLGDMGRITVLPRTYNHEELITGNVDAMSTYLSTDPFALKTKGVAVNIIDPRSYGIDFYGDNLFTTENEINDHPKRVDKMIRATLKGWIYALEHKEEIIDLIIKNYNPDLDRLQLRYEAKVIDQMIMPDLVPIGDINPRRYERIAETYKGLGMTGRSDIPDGFIYMGESEPIVVLTAMERAWLKAHPGIQFGFADDYRPALIVGENGTLSGILKDLLDLYQ